MRTIYHLPSLSAAGEDSNFPTFERSKTDLSDKEDMNNFVKPKFGSSSNVSARYNANINSGPKFGSSGSGINSRKPPIQLPTAQATAAGQSDEETESKKVVAQSNVTVSAFINKFASKTNNFNMNQKTSVPGYKKQLESSHSGQLKPTLSNASQNSNNFRKSPSPAMEPPLGKPTFGVQKSGSTGIPSRFGPSKHKSREIQKSSKYVPYQQSEPEAEPNSPPQVNKKSSKFGSSGSGLKNSRVQPPSPQPAVPSTPNMYEVDSMDNTSVDFDSNVLIQNQNMKSKSNSSDFKQKKPKKSRSNSPKKQRSKTKSEETFEVTSDLSSLSSGSEASELSDVTTEIHSPKSVIKMQRSLVKSAPQESESPDENTIERNPKSPPQKKPSNLKQINSVNTKPTKYGSKPSHENNNNNNLLRSKYGGSQSNMQNHTLTPLKNCHKKLSKSSNLQKSLSSSNSNKLSHFNLSINLSDQINKQNQEFKKSMEEIHHQAKEQQEKYKILQAKYKEKREYERKNGPPLARSNHKNKTKSKSKSKMNPKNTRSNSLTRNYSNSSTATNLTETPSMVNNCFNDLDSNCDSSYTPSVMMPRKIIRNYKKDSDLHKRKVEEIYSLSRKKMADLLINLDVDLSMRGYGRLKTEGF